MINCISHVKSNQKYEKVDNVSKVSALYQCIIMLEFNDHCLILYAQVSFMIVLILSQQLF